MGFNSLNYNSFGAQTIILCLNHQALSFAVGFNQRIAETRDDQDFSPVFLGLKAPGALASMYPSLERDGKG